MRGDDRATRKTTELLVSSSTRLLETTELSAETERELELSVELFVSCSTESRFDFLFIEPDHNKNKVTLSSLLNELGSFPHPTRNSKCFVTYYSELATCTLPPPNIAWKNSLWTLVHMNKKTKNMERRNSPWISREWGGGSFWWVTVPSRHATTNRSYLSVRSGQFHNGRRHLEPRQF